VGLACRVWRGVRAARGVGEVRVRVSSLEVGLGLGLGYLG